MFLVACLFSHVTDSYKVYYPWSHDHVHILYSITFLIIIIIYLFIFPLFVIVSEKPHWGGSIKYVCMRMYSCGHLIVDRNLSTPFKNIVRT